MKKVALQRVFLIFLLGLGLGALGNNYYNKHLKKDPYPYRIGYI